MNQWKNSYHLYAWITITGWGLAFVFTRIGLQELSYTTLGLLRNGIASLALIALVFILKIQPFQKKDTGRFILSGGSGFFLFILIFNKGAQTVTAATASVIMATVPIMTALIAWAFYREKLQWFQWVAIVIEVGGIILLTRGQGDLSANHGIIWLLLAALSLSVYNIIQKKLTRTYEPLRVSVYSVLVGTLFFLIFLPSSFPEVKTLTLPLWGIVITLGVVSTAIAYICWAKAFSLAENTSQVSNYMFITPLLATVFGIFLVKEIPDKYFLQGSFVILSGLLLFNKGHLILGKK